MALQLRPVERTRKEAAIRCHASQLLFHHRGFLDRSRWESFVVQGTRPLHDAHHVVHGVRVDRGALSINLVTRTGWWSGLTRLHLIGYASHLGVIRRTLPLPSHSGWVPLRDSQSDRTVARASVTRGWRRARLRIPLGALVRSDRLFIKLEHRELFFDTAGWRDVLHLGRQVNETGDPNLAAQTCEVSPKRQAMSRLSG